MFHVFTCFPMTKYILHHTNKSTRYFLLRVGATLNACSVSPISDESKHRKGLTVMAEKKCSFVKEEVTLVPSHCPMQQHTPFQVLSVLTDDQQKSVFETGLDSCSIIEKTS